MKGFFTQGVALLLERPVELVELAPLLEKCGDLRRIDGAGDWTLGEATLLVPFPSGPGHVAIDVVARPWPDEMGDPESEPQLFSAWSTGHFGPFTFPGSFERACRQAWIWKEAQAEPPGHQAFVRVRTSQALGEAFGLPGDAAKEAAPNPLVELRVLTAVVAALARHPAAICYFNPSGETVLPPGRLAEAIAWAAEEQVPALDVWSNVRFLNLDGLADGWFLMDTVGMWQLDVPDHEIFLPGKTYNFQEVEGFLRNVSLYLLNHGPVFADGDTIDGPGGIDWVARNHEESFTTPPRPVIRWFAAEGEKPPSLLSEPGAKAN